MSESAATQAAGMPCPRCRVDLVITERMGVEIDFCPKCRGVWLDRGELDKIIERSEQFSAKPAEAPPASPAQSPWQPASQGQAQQPAPQQQGGWNQVTMAPVATAPFWDGCSADQHRLTKALQGLPLFANWA
jgi:Zn-finger nucleic acid-binding protein